MGINILIESIQNTLNNNEDTNIDFVKMNERFYSIRIIAPKNSEGINIPYVLAIPRTINIGNKLIVESNNFEGDDNKKMIDQVAYTVQRLSLLSQNKPATIVVPLIPQKEGEPYYRQLSRQCFELDGNNKYHRIDEQLARIIENARTIVENELGISIDKKIFMNGYSSSGVFAQRFALLHPELIDTLCIGGAIGTIPILVKDLEYPIGIKDYEELFGKKFDIDNYLKIKHRYYVGELEAKALSNERVDETGKPAPVHDMSYFDMSVPYELGTKLRNIYGVEIISRLQNVVELLRNNEVDIQYTIFPGRTHNNESGKGVNELGDRFINDSYTDCIGRDSDINSDIIKDFKMHDIIYSIRIIAPKREKGINIPYLLAIPKTANISNTIAVESNNFESDNDLDMLNEVAYAVGRLALLTKNKPAPIVIPFIPSRTGEPYYRQLSKECFELDSDNKYYRIDMQLVKIIEDVYATIQNEFGKSMNKKVFMNGYSSSGVFAQRFALLHPELIDTLCVGGATGTMPIPTKELGYPIGIKDYEELFGQEFDIDSYLKIKHRYYVGELESVARSDKRFDESGKRAPLHDMTYFNMSVPEEIGIKVRESFGVDIIQRFQKTAELLKNEGIDMQYTIFPGRTHNDESGKGVNELGDRFINDSYMDCIGREFEDSVYMRKTYDVNKPLIQLYLDEGRVYEQKEENTTMRQNQSVNLDELSDDELSQFIKEMEFATKEKESKIERLKKIKRAKELIALSKRQDKEISELERQLKMEGKGIYE